MEMPNVQVQTPSSQSSTAASNSTSSSATSVASGEASSGSFVEALIKVIEGQSSSGGEQDAGSADAGAAMVTAILPSSIVNLISNQPTTEDVKEMVQALIQVIESMNPEQLEQLKSQPELQQWMASVIQLSNQQMNNSLITVRTQDVMSTMVAQPLTLDTATDDIKGVLNRYLEIAKSNPTHPIVQQLGSELKQITAKLSDLLTTVTAASNQNVVANSVNPIAPLVNPVAVEGNTIVAQQSTNASNESTVASIVTSSASTVNAAKSEGAKLDKSTGTSLLNFQLTQSSGQSQSSGETLNQQQSKGSQSQLLQRLASISPNVTSTVQSALTNEALTSTIVTSNVESNDTLLTLSQASELPKLTAMSSEAKVTMPTVSAEAFAEEMTRFIVKNMSITQFTGNGGSEAKISLVPEHLGQVDVKISVINGQITAHFMAESAHARDLLELQLPQLRASLQQQGLQVDKLNVEQQSNLASSLFQEQRHQQTSQQFAQSTKKSTKDYDQFGADFTLEMDQAVRINRLAYGNTFNATA